MSTKAIYGESCPQCKTWNYFDQPSKWDVEALECWNCRHKWLLEMCEEWTTLEDANLEKGRKQA